MRTTFLLFLLFFLPWSAQAATLLIEPSFERVEVGDIFIIDIRLDPKKVSLNAVEGSITFSDNLAVREIRTGTSIVPLWVTHPTVTGNIVSFAGVIPRGFDGAREVGSGEEKGSLFQVIVEARNEGAITVSVGEETTLYQNDGEGSVVAFTTSFDPLNIKLSTGSPRNGAQISDTTPPEIFIPEKADGADFNLPGKVVVFETQDKQTRVVYYERARTIFPFIPKSSVWSLVDSPAQLSFIDSLFYTHIRAVDVANNVRIATIEPAYVAFLKAFVFTNLFVALLLVAVAGFLFFTLRSRKRI